ncbi:MAG: hypothetical protein QHJ73_05370 [Armatimonadota bacterium]|nr:hypothetical protein [Armatimonadota bacterium]
MVALCRTFLLSPVLALTAASPAGETPLLDEDFGAFELGLFSAPVGAHTEYHYLPEAAPRRGWKVACFATGDAAQRAWEVRQEDGRRAMVQTILNAHLHTHPMVAAGDPRWRDYRVRVRFAPRYPPAPAEKERAGSEASGLVFRYHNNRCYYFFGFQRSRVVLKRVRHETAFHQPDEKILAQVECPAPPQGEYVATVLVEGEHIRAEVEGVAVLKADDDTFREGGIGLLADVPTYYYSVQVTATPGEQRRFALQVAREERALADLRAANPRPVLWKKVKTSGFGVGRNLRFGDLDGDGQIDLLLGQVIHHGPRDQYSELSCLTAMTFDGEILWRIGTPHPERYRLTNDVAFQIHDLDRDGRNEVVYCMNQEIVVAEGATGKVKWKAPTPQSKPPANRFPRILGDCLFFCDLRGRGYPQDIVIKDRYWHFWTLTHHLEPLWEGSCRTGHYPFAADVDGDGHDELAIGYALFDHDGTLLWNLEEMIPDHADGIAIVDFGAPPSPRVFYAASDAGAVFADLNGRILKRHWIGHVQNPAVADFRPDLPGLEMVSINFWGNQGILHFYNAHGELYHDCEPNPFGSMCLPVNWTGRPGEYFVHNPNVRWGGMFDGWGRCVVSFPDDGHPDMCNAVLDLTGDCRDEVVVWNPDEIWVYTQEDNPKHGRLYRPKRNPLYNTSNYQATVSLPGWSE